MIGLLLSAQLALAGELYVNQTLVNPVDLQGMTLEKVDVSIDARGNIHIDAPGYKIQVVTPTAPAPAPVQNAAGGAGYYPPGAYGKPYGYEGPPPVQPKTLAPLDPSVPPATWWLVTEDGGTRGHTVEVWINDRLAQTVQSGQPQVILDVGKHIRHGDNQVLIKSTSVAPSGGSFLVFVGTGSDRSGTVVMDKPVVEFELTSRSNGPGGETYAFTY